MAQVEQEIERLRRKRKAMLIGGDWTDMMDPSDSFLQAGLDHLTNRAERLFRSMDPSNPDRLWPELEWREDASDIRSNYVRLKEMAVAYATPGSYLYRSASLCRAIVDGLEWVYRNRYNERVVFYGNWWQWEIGAPLALLDTLLLMDDEVDPDALAAYLRTVARCTPSPEPYFHTRRSEPKVSTGANRVWKCQVHLLASLLRGDAQSVREARDALSPVFAYVQAGDGFYEDGSFIQHTRHPYTGGYGKSLLRELADLLYLFDGSLWEVSRKYVRTVFRWVEDSFRPLMYNGMMADMSSGREISRSSHQNHEIGHVIIDALLRLTGLESAEGTDRLQRLAKLWMTRDMYRSYLKHAPLPLLTAAAGLLSDASVQLEEGSPECRIFAGMDQAVHRRGHFVFGVSMHSTRISTYESINGENLRGWYTSHGMTYVYNSDQGQYCDGFWPTVDPYRLPGTTVSDMPRSDGEDYAGPGLSSFAGGVLFGGQHGAAAMELYEPEPLVCRARKSWFMLGDVIVALGSGIHASGPRRLETIIDNRMLNRSGGNPVTVEADGTRRTLTSLGETTVLEPDWIHLEGNVPGADIGYYFPRKMQVSMLREARSGRWSDINAAGSIRRRPEVRRCGAERRCARGKG
jgi:hyaluronate lyase